MPDFPRLVSPIPKDPPQPPKERKGQPWEGYWVYRDAEGRALKVKIRFPDPERGKVVLPYTLWEIALEKLKWSQQDLPAPRPLYGLDRLASRPEAPVLVCEGEKTAEAAERIFPEWVAVTSGSATSARSTDWGPLQDRQVVVWPDHDAPGMKYAEDVLKALQGIAAHVGHVSVPESFPEKWDLADAFPAGFDADWALGQISDATKAEEKPQCPTEEAWTHPTMPTEKATPPKALKVVTAGAVLSSPTVPPRFIWEGWIPRGKVGMLAAVSDHGKTALMLQLASGVASARPVLGTPTTPTPCGVLLYSLEDDPEDFQPRLQWVLEGMNASGELSQVERDSVSRNLWFASPTYEVANLKFEKTAEEIRWHLKRMREQGIEPALVIVETLTAVSDGDEAKADSTRALWAAARNIANHDDVTVLITHHYRKESGGGKANRSSVVERIEPDKVRGSNANEGASRFVIQMGLPTMDEAEGAGLNGTKALNKGYAILRASKLKADKPDMMFLERIDKHQPGQFTWARHPKGGQIIADLLKSNRKAKELNLEDRVLVDLLRQGSEPDRKALLAIFKSAKNPDTALSNALHGLRKKGDLQKREMSLTVQGYERAQSLAQENERFLAESGG